MNENRTPASGPKPPRPVDDAERVEELHDLKVLDTAPEARFDRLTRKIADEMGVPAAYIALIDDERQWIKSKVGDLPTEIERDQSFCTYTIAGDRPLVVPDATADPRFAAKPLVTGRAGIRFYAGVPVAGPNGLNVGTVCITDDKPREITTAELAALKDHALRVQQEINALPTVFISYAHEDEAWKDRLVVHCSTLQRQGLLEIWNDREIGTGEDWAEKIRDAMERAKVAVLLVSADFLASDFIHRDEVPRLLERRDAEGLVVLPLLLKPCTWDEVQWLARMNLRPRDGHPLCAGREFEVDEQLARFASEIGATVRRLGRKVAPAEVASRTAQDRAPAGQPAREPAWTETNIQSVPPPPPEVRTNKVPLLAASILAASVLLVGGLWAMRGGIGSRGPGRDAGSLPTAPEPDGSTPQDPDHRPPAAAEPPAAVAGEVAVAAPPPSTREADSRERRSEVGGPSEERRASAPPAAPADSAPQPIPATGPPGPAPGPEPTTAGGQDPVTRTEEPPPPPTTAEPATQVPEPGEDKAILGTLDAYAAAMRSLDAAAVGRVRSDVDLEKLSEQFAMVQSQKFDLEDCAVRIEGGVMASVACRERVEVVPKRGINPPPMDHVIVFELHKQDGSWLIVGRSLGSR